MNLTSCFSLNFKSSRQVNFRNIDSLVLKLKVKGTIPDVNGSMLGMPL